MKHKTPIPWFAGALLYADSVPPLADTYTSSTTAAVNFGTNELLLISPTQRALLQFAAPSAPQGASLARATLTVFAARVATAGTIEVFPAQARWSESAVTHSTLPAAGARIATATAGAGMRFIDIEITAAVRSWIAGAANNCLLLTAATASLVLDSKENTSTSALPPIERFSSSSNGSLASCAVGRCEQSVSGRIDVVTP